MIDIYEDKGGVGTFLNSWKIRLYSLIAVCWSNASSFLWPRSKSPVLQFGCKCQMYFLKKILCTIIYIFELISAEGYCGVRVSAACFYCSLQRCVTVECKHADMQGGYGLVLWDQ